MQIRTENDRHDGYIENYNQLQQRGDKKPNRQNKMLLSRISFEET
jgi:hypothetical protein